MIKYDNDYTSALKNLDRLTGIIQFVRLSICHIPTEVQELEETNYDDHIRPLVAADYILNQIVDDLKDLHSEFESLHLQPKHVSLKD